MHVNCFAKIANEERSRIVSVISHLRPKVRAKTRSQDMVDCQAHVARKSPTFRGAEEEPPRLSNLLQFSGNYFRKG